VKRILSKTAYGSAWDRVDSMLGWSISESEMMQIVSGVAPPWRKQ